MTKPLRILFVTNRLPWPIRDGQSRRTFHILKGLCRHHQVYLLSLYAEPQEACPAYRLPFEEMCSGVELVQGPSKRLRPSMLAMLVRSLVSVHPYTLWRHYTPRMRQRIHALLVEGGFDLLHCDILPMAYVMHSLPVPVATAFTDHDVSHLKTRRMAQSARNPLLKCFLLLEAAKLKYLERTIFHQVDMGICVSDTDRNHLLALCPGATLAVIENGVDTDAFRPSLLPPHSGQMVWIGGFDHYPNEEGMAWFLERVFPRIKAEVPEARLDLVGGGVTARIQRAAADSGAQIHGFVEDPTPLLDRAAAFIAPLFSGSGTRLKIIEAMAAGQAIVTTAIGCEGIAGRNGHHYLIADTVDDFTRQTMALLKDGILGRQLGHAARELAVSRYDWRILAQHNLTLYRDLVTRRGGVASGVRRAES